MGYGPLQAQAAAIFDLLSDFGLIVGQHDASHDTCIVFSGQQCRVREIKEERKSHQGH